MTGSVRALGGLAPIAACVAATAAFQGGAALAKSLFPILGPQGTAALRLVFGAAMLLAYVQPWRTWPTRPAILPLLGLGAATAGAILFFYLAIGRIPLGMAISLQFLGPLTVAVAGSRRPRDFLWAALAALGVWALVGRSLAEARVDPIGIACAAAAGTCWASYILLGRSASRTFGRSTPALAVSIAALIVLPVGVAHAGAALLTPSVIPLALLIALVSAAIPFSLELYAMPRIPARTFAVLTSLEPAFGAMFGFVVLGERLAGVQLLGVGAVIAAAAGAAWSTAREPAALIDAPPT